MTHHVATVSRDGKFWLIDIAHVGATQAHRLTEVDEMARDYIRLMTDEPIEGIEVEVRVQLPADVAAAIATSRALRVEADDLRRRATGEFVRAARELKDSGLTVREIGRAMDISPQRAQQLVSA